MEKVKKTLMLEGSEGFFGVIWAIISHLYPTTQGQKGNKVRVVLVSEVEYEDLGLGPSSPLQFTARDRDPLRLLRRRPGLVIPISPDGRTDPAA